jgi:hypothetical protein
MEDDGRNARLPQVRLDAAVCVPERDRGTDLGAVRTDLDQAPNSGSGRCVDHVRLVLRLLRMVGSAQEHALNAVERGTDRGRGTRARSRTNARTGTPRPSSSSTTCEPTLPVAPITRTGVTADRTV